MSAIKDLLLATNNSKKLKEIQEILGNRFKGTVFCAADFPQYPEPEETGATFAENAFIKATYYSGRTGLITLADDSGLCVDALDGRPGVYSARYADTDQARIKKLREELKDVPTPKRSARFVCAMCAVLSDGSRLEQKGTMEGSIAFAPKGDLGFGYDPVFLVDGGEKTLAEMPSETKNSISHRGQAMKKIQPSLLDALTA